jgi:hypothetical protein
MSTPQPDDPRPRTTPRRVVADEGMGAVIAVVAVAAIMIAGLSYIYVSSQAPHRVIGVIGEATMPDLTQQPTN